jgi:2-polyprenyl-3-methyl-5-hydroxy-6-metoxy-1,4-benzoquinol methylase
MSDGPLGATAPADDDHQRLVNAHFHARSAHWRDLYGDETLWGAIHRLRRIRALAWIDALALPAGARVLEIGCGAGLLAVDLAQRGFVVDCIDASEAMIQLAREQALQAGAADRITAAVCDAHALEFADARFALVVSLGVLPFLHTPERAIAEMARVLAPGGSVLLSADNRARLNHVLDPRHNPALTAMARGLLQSIGRAPRRAGIAAARLVSARTLRRQLAAARLEPARHVTLGFGPFSLLGRALLSDPVGIRLHDRLQSLADRDLPPFRGTGAQHLVVARKSSPR